MYRWTSGVVKEFSAVVDSIPLTWSATLTSFAYSDRDSWISSWALAFNDDPSVIWSNNQ